MGKETKTQTTRKQKERQRSAITFFNLTVSLFKLLFIKKKKKKKGGKILHHSTSPVFCSCLSLSLPPSARVTEYYSVSFRERKGGTRLKGWWGEGGAQKRCGQTLHKL